MLYLIDFLVYSISDMSMGVLILTYSRSLLRAIYMSDLQQTAALMDGSKKIQVSAMVERLGQMAHN